MIPTSPSVLAPSPSAPLRPVIVALVIFAAGLALRLLLQPLLGSQFGFMFFIPAVGVAAWLGGRKAGLIVTLRSIGDAVTATDRAGRITFMNAVAERLTGWSFAATAGKPIETVFVIIAEDTRGPAALTDDSRTEAMRE